MCAVLFLDLLSIPLVDSATHSVQGHYYAKKQAILVLFSIIMLILGTLVDYRDLVRLWSWLYGLTLFLLVLVLLVGKSVYGSTRWLPLGFFDLQPSEVAKLTMIICCVKVLMGFQDPPESFWDFAVYYSWLVPPAVLILIQPDLGTALTLVAIATGMLYFAGAPEAKLAKMFGILLLACVVLLLLHIYFGLPLPLKEYQIKRIVGLFQADSDPLGTGYQVLQSKIAIGSGMLWGKGLGKGTQNRLEFIPEQHTDFIFSVVGEELGFFRSLLVLAAYFIILLRCLDAAVTSPDREGTLIAAGVLSLILFHVVVNIGMTMGIMPVTGVPLPFLSHGGSALMIDSFSIGLALNVGWKKYKILF